jgi:toxin CcdB
MTRLTPKVDIDGQSYLLLTPQLASISRKELGKTVANLGSYRNEIIGAVDFLLTGF